MSEEQTLDELLVTEREVTLPGGRKAIIRQVVVAEWQAALEAYSRLLGLLAMMAGEVTEESIARDMPGVMVELMTQGQAEPVDALLSRVCDVKSEDLLGLSLAAVSFLWREIERLNRVPFGLRLKQLKRAGMLDAMGALDLTTQISATSSEPQDSTPESQDSPSPTPSRRSKRARGTSGAETTSAGL